MTILKVAICDKCNTKLEQPDSRTPMRALMNHNGWKSVGSNDICKDCNSYSTDEPKADFKLRLK